MESANIGKPYIATQNKCHGSNLYKSVT